MATYIFCFLKKKQKRTENGEKKTHRDGADPPPPIMENIVFFVIHLSPFLWITEDSLSFLNLVV